jgi:hypothetical protein
MEMLIPFAGFYGSVHSEEVDYVHESLSMNDHGERDETLWDHLFNACSWSGAYHDYAREYARLLAYKFKVKFEFKMMISPREYNFTTDRIYVEIELAEVRRLYTEIDKGVLRKLVKERCSSRNGFISFYPNNVDVWSDDLEKWDHNMLGIMFEAWIETTQTELDELDVMEVARSNGKVEEWIFANMKPEDVTKYNQLRQETLED